MLDKLQGVFMHHNPMTEMDLKQSMRDRLIDHRRYITRYGEDTPEIRDWSWPVDTG
jgi:xylulose-5-phosphate/fructose-6-phosphate phosphoketolase